MTDTTRCRLYIRVSTEEQVAHGESLEVQRERLEAFAKVKGWVIAGIYADEGRSAKDLHRPEYQRFKQELQHGEVLLCTKLDRMFRSTKDFLNETEDFEQRGIKFVCLDADIDTTTPAGRVFSTMRAAFAQFERETASERTKEVMVARAKKGLWNGGPVPFGYTCDPETKTLKVHPEEAEVVRRLFDLYVETGSFLKTTYTLNALGYRTRAGKPWYPFAVRFIIGCPLYAGIMAYNRRTKEQHRRKARPLPSDQHILVEGAIEPIISRELYDQVQALAAQQTYIPPATKGSPHLLSGLLTCGRCGGKMHFVASKRGEKLYTYYKCRTYREKGKSICPGLSIPAVGEGGVETRLIADLRRLALNPAQLRQWAKDARREFEATVQPLVEETRVLEREIAQAKAAKDKLFQGWERGLISEEEFLERKRALDGELAALAKAQEAVQGRIQAAQLSPADIETTLLTFKTLAEVYDELTIEEQRQLLRILLAKAVVHPDGVEYAVRSLKGIVLKGSLDDKIRKTRVWPSPPRGPGPLSSDRGLTLQF